MYIELVATLAEIVKQRRKAMGVTQRVLADQVGVSQTYIYNIENEKTDIPSPDVMGRLAKVLGIAEETLLQSVGYLKGKAEEARQLWFPRPLGPEEFWNQLVEVYDGDEDAARRFLYETLGEALPE